MRFFVWQLLIAIDQFLNALFLGWADETLSSRAYRMSMRADSGLFGWRWRLCATLINALFFDRNHCHDAYQGELTGRHLPPNFRGGK